MTIGSLKVIIGKYCFAYRVFFPIYASYLTSLLYSCIVSCIGEKEEFTKDKYVSVVALFEPHKMMKPLSIFLNGTEVKIDCILDTCVINEKNILSYKYIVKIDNQILDLYYNTFTSVWFVK